IGLVVKRAAHDVEMQLAPRARLREALVVGALRAEEHALADQRYADGDGAARNGEHVVVDAVGLPRRAEEPLAIGCRVVVPPERSALRSLPARGLQSDEIGIGAGRLGT